jgi:TPR repeat protein
MANAAPSYDDLVILKLIRDGNSAMRQGDFAAARLLFEQAGASGSPEAALAMGRSFDPLYFENLPVKTGRPDPEAALRWYQKALDGGIVTATVKISLLKERLGR